jgi:hypothetical protein
MGSTGEVMMNTAPRLGSYGFNAVRLPWSNQLYESNPIVSSTVVSANPQFSAMYAMDDPAARADGVTISSDIAWNRSGAAEFRDFLC